MIGVARMYRFFHISRSQRICCCQLPHSTARITFRSFTNRNILTLEERGMVSQIFPDDRKALTNLCIGKPQTVYAGFDPTAESLHVGNLAIIMMMLQCQRAGHRVIALIGGATGLVGDPSGKNKERPKVNPDFIRDNCFKISQNITTIFNNHEKYFWDSKRGTEKLPALKIVNNKDWYDKISSIELIGNFGKHFRIAEMINRQVVKTRLEGEGMSFTEFAYQIFQGYDWYHLNKLYNCNIQIGGHDQLGNIVAGHDLISRAVDKQVYGVTVPLVTSETGNKYGKTAGNAVWLDAEKTSPFDLYQFLIRTSDSNITNLLNIFSFKTKDEIATIMKKHEKNPEKRYAATVLAEELTKLVHGENGVETAKRASEALYSGDVEALKKLTHAEVSNVFKSVGSNAVGQVELILEPGTTILDMAMKAGCFKSLHDAIRIMQAGGFYLNYQRVQNYEEVLVPGIHVLPNQLSLARVGKRNYYVIKWS